MSGYRTRNRHHVLTLEEKVVPGPINATLFVGTKYVGWPEDSGLGTPPTCASENIGRYNASGTWPAPWPTGGGAVSKTITHNYSATLGAYGIPTYTRGFSYSYSGDVDSETYYIDPTKKAEAFARYRDSDPIVTPLTQTRDKIWSMLPTNPRYGSGNQAIYSGGMSDGEIIGSDDSGHSLISMYLVTQFDEPTPGAYTFPAGTNVNALHHMGIPSSIQGETLTASATTTGAGGLSVTVDVTHTHRWSVNAYYLLRPIDRNKFYDNMATKTSIPFFTGTNSFATKISDSQADTFAAYIEGLTAKGVDGDPATGLTMESDGRIYGAIFVAKMLEHSITATVNGQMGTTPFPFAVYATPTTTLNTLIKKTWTQANIETPSTWVAQSPY